MRGYDAWLTTQPEPPDVPLPGDPDYPRCGRCGAFLRRDPDSTHYGETRGHAWTEALRRCGRCGHVSTEIQP